MNPYSDLPFWWVPPPSWWSGPADLYPLRRYDVQLRCTRCGGTEDGDGRHDWDHAWVVS